jgi:serine/threonine-protein kinase
VTTGAEAAVKLLPLKRLASPEMVARFHREAEIARALSSPHVVRVLDVSPPEAELPYLVMERLHGDDLGHTLREERKLPLRAAVELVQQVAEGLEAARAAGIVHRDLKPSNLFRAGGGGDAPVWKILDFSVSKLAGGGGTITNDQAIGTPGYMAPEQARGLDVDHRADVYGLAAVAYRVLTGHATFAGDDVPSLLYRVVHHMPRRPGELQPMPPEVELVLAIGLAKEPGERFPTARELAAALTAAARGELDAWSRSRARTLLADRPWGSERSLSRRG